MQKILVKIRYFERGSLKKVNFLRGSFKKLTIFFLLNPVPFNSQSYEKQKDPGTSDQLLFRS